MFYITSCGNKVVTESAFVTFCDGKGIINMRCGRAQRIRWVGGFGVGMPHWGYAVSAETAQKFGGRHAPFARGRDGEDGEAGGGGVDEEPVSMDVGGAGLTDRRVCRHLGAENLIGFRVFSVK